MTKQDVLDAVMAYHEAHGRFPQRAYVDILTADALCDGVTCFDVKESWRFGQNTLGITDWFVDPKSDGTRVRFAD